MDVQLAGIWQEKFILVHWGMDLKSEENPLSFDEFRIKREKEKIKNRLFSKKNTLKQSNIVLKFDISNNKLFLNHYEVFKHSYLEESLYMGGKEKFIKYIQNYFREKNIEIMLNTLIESDKTREKDKEILEKYLIINVKQNKVYKSEAKTVYRYNLDEDSNLFLNKEIEGMISLLKHQTKSVAFGSSEYVDLSQRIVKLRNIVDNVKQIKVTKQKINATFNAREKNKENSIKKIENAYQILLQNSQKITIYSVAKEAGVSHATAKKYKEIFEKDLS